MIAVTLDIEECRLVASALEELYRNEIMGTAHPQSQREALELVVRLTTRNELTGIDGTEADYIMAGLQWVWDNPVAYSKRRAQWLVAARLYRKVRDACAPHGIEGSGWITMFRPYLRPGLAAPAAHGG